jgi:hypothetical protein
VTAPNLGVFSWVKMRITPGAAAAAATSSRSILACGRVAGTITAWVTSATGVSAA